MSIIKFSYEEIETAASSLQYAKQEIEQKLDSLATQIQTLVDSAFVTEQASFRFNEAYQNFRVHAKQTVSSLDEMAMFLRSSVSTLRDFDTQMAASILG